MAVDLRKIKKLIEIVEESGIAELEVRDGDETIRIARSTTPTITAAAPAPAAIPATERAAEPAPGVDPRPAPGFAVHSPIAGTFYRAPSPDAAAYVEVGQAVAAGDVLCIIESMKMMNEIVAEQDGVCTAIIADNGHPVSSGDVLFRFA